LPPSALGLQLRPIGFALGTLGVLLCFLDG